MQEYLKLAQVLIYLSIYLSIYLIAVRYKNSKTSDFNQVVPKQRKKSTNN